MLQFLLMVLLALIVLLFLFSLKIFFMLIDFSKKLAELDARVIRIEKMHFETKADMDKLKDKFKYILQTLNGFREKKQ